MNATLPAATGGDGTLSHTIRPALPAGLVLGTTAPTITGTPTAAKTETTYTLTAHDADGDTATFAFPLAVARTDAPKVTSVSVTSGPSRGGRTYAAGDAIVVRVGFDKLVVTGGTPRLALGIGTATRQASFDRTSSTPRSLDFRYTVVAADRDPDGISVAEHALTLAGDRVRGPAGVHAHLDLGSHAFANASAHKVDGSLAALVAGPAVSAVTITSSPTRGDAYRADENIVVQVRFTGNVLQFAGDAVERGLKTTLALGVGTATRQARAAALGTRTLNFRYTVVTGDRDPDGISIAADALALDGVTLRGIGGEVAQLDLGSNPIADAAGHLVDGGGTATRPSFGSPTAVALTYTAGTAVDQALPAATGSGTLTYTLGGTPALPAGLTFYAPGAATGSGGTASGGGAIAGTPTAALARTTYALTATDADGFTARFAFTIAGTDALPTFGAAAVPAQHYTRGVAAATLTLPAATGGNGALTYRLGSPPALPAGLTYSAPGETVRPGVTASGGGTIADRDRGRGDVHADRDGRRRRRRDPAVRPGGAGATPLRRRRRGGAALRNRPAGHRAAGCRPGRRRDGLRGAAGVAGGARLRRRHAPHPRHAHHRCRRRGGRAHGVPDRLPREPRRR